MKRYTSLLLLSTFMLGLFISCGGHQTLEICEFYKNIFGWRIGHPHTYICKGDTSMSACARAARQFPLEAKVQQCYANFSSHYHQSGALKDPLLALRQYVVLENDPSCSSGESITESQRKCYYTCSGKFSTCRTNKDCNKDSDNCETCLFECNRAFIDCKNSCR